MAASPSSPSPAFVGRVLTAVAVVAATGLVLALLWFGRGIVFLAFGAVLVAVVLRSAGRGVRRVIPRLRDAAAVGLAALVLVGAVAAFVWAVAPRIAEEGTTLAQQLPAAIESARTWVAGQPWGAPVLDAFGEPDPNGTIRSVAGSVPTFLGGLLGGVLNALVMVVAGLFMALNPALYMRGAVKLVPIPRRARAREVLLAVGDRLRGWLVGQLIAMSMVGVLTGVGLALLGVPLALVLGVIAFATDFIPFIGPFLGAVPALLMAFTQGPETALYVALLFFAVQQIESYVVVPLVQQKTISLAPALQMLVAILGGVLFGLPGTILATPLLVVVLTLVEELYVRDALGDDTVGADARVEGDEGHEAMEDVPVTPDRSVATPTPGEVTPAGPFAPTQHRPS